MRATRGRAAPPPPLGVLVRRTTAARPWGRSWRPPRRDWRRSGRGRRVRRGPPWLPGAAGYCASNDAAPPPYQPPVPSHDRGERRHWDVRAHLTVQRQEVRQDGGAPSLTGPGAERGSSTRSSRSRASAARPRDSRAFTVPVGAPTILTTSSTGRSETWCSAIASRWTATGQAPPAPGSVDGHGQQPSLGVLRPALPPRHEGLGERVLRLPVTASRRETSDG